MLYQALFGLDKLGYQKVEELSHSSKLHWINTKWFQHQYWMCMTGSNQPCKISIYIDDFVQGKVDWGGRGGKGGHSQSKGPMSRQYPNLAWHFGNAHQPWTLSIIMHELNFIMNLNSCRSRGIGGRGFLHMSTP